MIPLGQSLSLFSTLLDHEVAGEGGLDESSEERVRLVRLGLKLGVELYANEPWMVFDLHDFDQVAFWIHARYA